MMPRRAAVLRQAADGLLTYGWYGGHGKTDGFSWIGPTGCLCAGTAIGMALGLPGWPTKWMDDEYGEADDPRYDALAAAWCEYSELVEYLHDQLGVSLYAWNDQAGRRMDEVLDMLRKAARQAEEDEHGGAATSDPPGQGPDLG